MVIKNLTLQGYSQTFPPPSPGDSITISFTATADLWFSLNGGVNFLPYTAPCSVTMRVAGRIMEP